MDRFEVQITGTCNATAQVDNAACARAYLDNLVHPCMMMSPLAWAARVPVQGWMDGAITATQN